MYKREETDLMANFVDRIIIKIMMVKMMLKENAAMNGQYKKSLFHVNGGFSTGEPMLKTTVELALQTKSTN